jgi:hypothetical protein
VRRFLHALTLLTAPVGSWRDASCSPPTADGTAIEFRGTGVLDPVLRGIVDGDGMPKAMPKASGSRWSHHRFRLTVPLRGQVRAA